MPARYRLLAALLLFAAAFLVIHGHGRTAAAGRAAIRWVLDTEVHLPRSMVQLLRQAHVPLAGVAAPPTSTSVGRRAPRSFAWPLDGVAERLGDRLALLAPAGTAVHAVADGQVIEVRPSPEGGRVLEVAGPYRIAYDDLGWVSVSAGLHVHTGQLLGVLRHEGPGVPTELVLTVWRSGRIEDALSLLEGQGRH